MRIKHMIISSCISALLLLPIFDTAYGAEGTDAERALEVLGSDSATPEQVVSAQIAIAKQYPNGGEEAVGKLAKIWQANSPDRLKVILGKSLVGQTSAMSLACAMADEKTATLILNEVRGKLDSQDMIDKFKVRLFFADNAESLVGKVPGRELIDLAIEAGASYAHWKLPQEEIDSGIVRELRSKKGNETHGGSVSLMLSEKGLPKLVQMVREVTAIEDSDEFITVLHRDGTLSAIDTLAEWSCEDALPLFLEIKSRLPKDSEVRSRLNRYIVKLKWQNDIPTLMQIINTEREDIKLLYWAVLRALKVGADPDAVYGALQQNRQTIETGSLAGHDIAAQVQQSVFPGRPGDLPPHPMRKLLKSTYDPLVFDRDEFREYRQAVKGPSSPEKMKSLMNTYSVGAILKKAGVDAMVD